MKIRIIAVPAGEAPLEIRKQWVGVVVPYDPIYTVVVECASA